jgi:hypothetical protein
MKNSDKLQANRTPQSAPPTITAIGLLGHEAELEMLDDSLACLNLKLKADVAYAPGLIGKEPVEGAAYIELSLAIGEACELIESMSRAMVEGIRLHFEGD